MRIKQVRNATLRLDFGGVKFLVDPYLAKKDAYPGFDGTVNSHIRNPRLELQTPMEEILGVDAVIVTHTHPDHWDEAAVQLAPKHLPLFAQHERDADLIRSQGFSDVRILTEETTFRGVSLIKTRGQHGTDEALAAAKEVLGEVCGVVFTHPDERTLYLAGDTIWNGYVASNLASYEPEIVVLNAGDAQVQGLGSIIMGTEDVKKVHQAAPQAILIASHMEAVNHSVLSRTELRSFAAESGMGDRLLVPEDDQAYTF
ncbi:MBL fold metallo-hydrolase [Roseomonas sp. SSH11]|uniref:MBL fold metallo-hydrolase n=1 Tax=Pararoseomonas baculiformis TaxID=2820812 RepID=A0ABS4ALU7_9PROT|nr:MBL fold metallo-hydrolase [Pararoseomonas baculiformis]MBP0447505.1 MBL fold metallo-hydrolase [Pararoseomonas baculiformis]